METIFSKIIAGTIPCEKVYEDDRILAFLDINPVNHGHTLVVPKEHATNIFDVTPQTLAGMAEVAQKVATAQTTALGCNGVNLVMNNGEAAGQEVPHIHLHVIPRFTDDGKMPRPHKTPYENDEANTVAAKLASAID